VEALFKAWAGALWFTPGSFLNKTGFGQAERVYVPYWRFNVETKTKWSGEVRVFEDVLDPKTGQPKKEAVWKDAFGTNDGQYNDITLPASKSPVAELCQQFKKAWLLEKAVCSVGRLPPDALSQLEKPCPWTELWEKHSEDIKRKEEQMCRQQIESRGLKVRKITALVTFSNLEQRLVYFPVYVSGYTFESRPFMFVVNGQTGEAAGQRPYGLGTIEETGKEMGSAAVNWFEKLVSR